MKHTELPWNLDQFGNVKSIKGQVSANGFSMICTVSEAQREAKENTELIVRAVNSHAALVGALEQVLGDCIFPGSALSDVYENVQKALALAKGE